MSKAERRILAKRLRRKRNMDKAIYAARMKLIHDKFEEYLYLFTENYLGYKKDQLQAYIGLYKLILKNLKYCELLEAKKLLSKINHSLIIRDHKFKLMKYLLKLEEKYLAEFNNSESYKSKKSLT